MRVKVPTLKTMNVGQTPLWLAAKNGLKDDVRLQLHRRDINPNDKDTACRTPLWWATHNGHEGIVDLLLAKKGVDVDAAAYGSKDETPLYIAAQKGHSDIVKLLLAKDGVDVNTWYIYIDMLLEYAVKNGDKELIKLLLRRFDIGGNSKIANHQTLLWLAAETGNMGVVKLLTPSESITLHVLVEEGVHSLVKVLLNGLYDPDTEDPLGRTPLHIAVLFDRLEIAAELIASGATVNYKDGSGMTPLHLAIQRKDRNIIDLLLANSAQANDIMATDWLDAFEN